MLALGALFSGGKDSTYALHWAVAKGFDVRCLITVIPRSEDSMIFHRPAVEYTALQSRALGIPQIVTRGRSDREVEDLKGILESAVKSYELDGIVTGALLSDYQRIRINMLCEELGLRTYSPLWRKDQGSYMLDLVDGGFRFIITSISAMGLPPRLLGRVIDRGQVEEIIRLSARYGFNPAFEGGEAETFVVDAPLFKFRVLVRGIVEKVSEYSWRYVIKEASPAPKRLSKGIYPHRVGPP